MLPVHGLADTVVTSFQRKWVPQGGTTRESCAVKRAVISARLREQVSETQVSEQLADELAMAIGHVRREVVADPRFAPCRRAGFQLEEADVLRGAGAKTNLDAPLSVVHLDDLLVGSKTVEPDQSVIAQRTTRGARCYLGIVKRPP